MPHALPFRFLLSAERKLLRAYPSRAPVDLRRGDPEADDPAHAHRWGRSRTVRARFLASLLLGGDHAEPGSVPGVRLAGARIVGPLDLHDAELRQSLQLDGCAIEEVFTLADASTKGVRLRHCRIRRINASRARIGGDLTLSDASLTEGIELTDAHVTGQVRLSRARVASPTREALEGDPDVAVLPAGRSDWAVWAGGLSIDGGFFGARMHCDGGIRLPGARLRGGLYLQGAAVYGRRSRAISADSAEAGVMELSGGFSCHGTVRLRGARVAGVLSFDQAHLSAPERSERPRELAFDQDPPEALDRAVHLSHAQVGELILRPASIAGTVNLAYSHFGVIFDVPEAYRDGVRLNGTTYEQLRGPWTPAQRRRWVSPPAPEAYRPQPYEQLAAWHRAIGNEFAAHRVLLDKQRARHRTLGAAGRLWGVLLDGVVGYGYRPWLAAVWAAVLLAFGTAVFHGLPPSQIPLDEERTFHAFVYTLDLLVPVSVFEQRGAWQPVGWTQWLAWGLIASGWILATALIAGATRVLRPASSGT